MNTNKVTIKIMADESHILKTLDMLENLFPLSIRSKIVPSDDGVTVHCWLTVSVGI
jgi:hypothetical protein